MANYKAEGIILRSRQLGDADRLITFISLEHGKVVAVARGVRRPGSRLAPGVQLFTHSQLLLWQGRNLDGISQAQVIDSFHTLRSDLTLLAVGSYACELVDEFTRERDQQPRIFRLLLQVLTLLTGGGGPDLILRYFELRLLSLTGFEPRLTGCVACGTSWPEPVAGAVFSPRAGGLLCSRCRQGPADTGELISLSPGTVKAMVHLLQARPTAPLKLRLNERIAAELAGVLHPYLAFVLEKDLKSREFWDIIKEKP